MVREIQKSLLVQSTSCKRPRRFQFYVQSAFDLTCRGEPWSNVNRPNGFEYVCQQSRQGRPNPPECCRRQRSRFGCKQNKGLESEFWSTLDLPSWSLLLGLGTDLTRWLLQNGALGNEHNVLATELLLQFTNQSILNLLESLQLGNRHIDDDRLLAHNIHLTGTGYVQLSQCWLEVTGQFQIEDCLWKRWLKHKRFPHTSKQAWLTWAMDNSNSSGFSLGPFNNLRTAIVVFWCVWQFAFCFCEWVNECARFRTSIRG